MQKKSGNGVFLAGVILGGLFGAVAGLLAAPRSGKDTREILKKTASALPELAEDLSTTVQMRADQLSESSKRNWEDTLVRLKEAIAAGIAASQLDSSNSEDIPTSTPKS